MSERISCCVPFCAHTRGDRKNDPLLPDTEWLCEEHWKLVPVRLKRRRAKLRRIDKRANDVCVEIAVERLDGLVWNVCKRYAIERAAGI